MTTEELELEQDVEIVIEKPSRTDRIQRSDAARHHRKMVKAIKTIKEQRLEEETLQLHLKHMRLLSDKKKKAKKLQNNCWHLLHNDICYICKQWREKQMSNLFKFSYFCNHLNRKIVQVNIFKSIDEAVTFAAARGSNAIAELWDGNENY